MDLENFVASHLVRDPDLDLPVKSAWPSKSRIDSVRPVCSSNYDDVSSSAHSVHQRKELCDDASLYFSGDLFSLGCDGVHFVDEYDAWSCLLGFLEYFPQPGFGFAVEL